MKRKDNKLLMPIRRIQRIYNNTVNVLTFINILNQSVDGYFDHKNCTEICK